jgi:hypothetical protein
LNNKVKPVGRAHPIHYKDPLDVFPLLTSEKILFPLARLKLQLRMPLFVLKKASELPFEIIERGRGFACALFRSPQKK